jgi:hypothetical protein
MSFITSAVDVLKILVIALGAGLAVWGVVNLWKATATIIRCEVSGHQATHGWRWCHPDRYYAYSASVRSVRL